MPTFGLERGTERTNAVRAHLLRMQQTLNRLGGGNRMLLVNDTPEAKNHTSAVLAEFGLSELLELRAPAGQGIGFCRFLGAQQAFERTDADLVVVMNDNSSFHLPEFTAEVARHFAANGWDVAVGARPGNSMNMDNFSLPMLATETKINFRAAALFDLFHLFPDGYPDLVSGISAISRRGMEGFDRACQAIGVDLLEILPALRYGYDTFVPVLFHLLGFKVGAVPFDPPAYFKDPANKAAEHLDPKQFRVRDEHYAGHELALRRLLELNARHKLAVIDPIYPSLALASPENVSISGGAVYNLEARLRAEGLGEFVQLFPPGFFNRIISAELEMSRCHNPAMLEKAAGRTTVSVWDAMETLNITNHTLMIYQSLGLFRSAPGAEDLRKLGKPELAGPDGLAPSATIIRELAGILKELSGDPAIAAALYAGILVHDIGKFISQTNHFENSYLLLLTSSPLRQVLDQVLNPEQLASAELIARYHSIYTDTMIAKERDVLKPYEVVLKASPVKEKQLLANDLLYAVSILDTHSAPAAGSRLSNDRLQELAGLHADIRAVILAGKTFEEIQINSSEIYRQWGKNRFASWVLGETDLVSGAAPVAIRQAEAELASLLLSPEALDEFYFALGGIKYCGLIFDLRKELESPAQRVRFLVALAGYGNMTGATWFEFKLHRDRLKWVGPQVEYVRSALRGDFDPEKIIAALGPQVNADGITEFTIPA